MQDRHGNQNDPLYSLDKTVRGGLVGMNMLSGSYRVVHYRLGSPGSRAIDRWVWIGAGIGYPACIILWPPVGLSQHRAAYLLWLTLIALTFLHSSAAYWSRARRHSQEIGSPVAGRLFEAPIAIGVALLADDLCGPGAGIFLAAGLVANMIQIGLIKARFRRMAALQDDAQLEAEMFRSSMK